MSGSSMIWRITVGRSLSKVKKWLMALLGPIVVSLFKTHCHNNHCKVTTTKSIIAIVITMRLLLEPNPLTIIACELLLKPIIATIIAMWLLLKPVVTIVIVMWLHLEPIVAQLMLEHTHCCVTTKTHHCVITKTHCN